MHEVLTLQLGQKSNYLATHFWNTQESYFTYTSEEESLVDHDVHFRPGIGTDGSETFTPRTLIYDLKGGFGSMRKINALYEIDEPAVGGGLWNGPAVVQRQEAIQQNEYQRSLEEGSTPTRLTPQSVRYWSDFNRVYYHPRSIVQLNEYELNSSLAPFENWKVGEELFNSLDKEHDLLDRDLRYFAEEADKMQGIQLITGLDDAWGGFAARYLERIRDEYGKTSVLLWGLEDNVKSVPREKRSIKLSNIARSFSELAPQASVFIPLSTPSGSLPPYIKLIPQSDWHVSALLAAAVESATLPSRLRSSNPCHENFSLLANSLNINGNQSIAKLQMSIDQGSVITNGHEDPANMNGATESCDSRVNPRNYEALSVNEGDQPRKLDINLFPSESGDSRVTRRYKKSHVFGEAEVARTAKHPQQLSATSGVDGYERARRRAAGLPIMQLRTVPLLFPLLDSFPDIILGGGETLTSVSVTTSLSTDSAVASRIKNLQYVVNRTVAVDEREALANSLGEIAEAYEEGYDSGTDEDDD
ncbi:tubulin domain-containing protein [Amylocarpus encephaloides]|uniref:Tubulin domain-containing protein n=1 Tax=Amylocarpus encephaloides TaxID=45428 RepID=A0A9P7YI74_9HELO|nr:tubulin domain-containing protein [Amylocarpus encephaloides]